MCKVLVTGASGFIGRAVVGALNANRCNVIGAMRRPNDVRWAVPSPFLSDDADWRAQLEGRTVVVHAAARAHMLNDRAADPLAEFRRINVAGTLRLAEQAAEMGVRRFMFVSTIGVNGAETFQHPFTSEDQTAPHSPYAVSKHEAEQGLLRVADETGLEVVIIRPPLVYGPVAPGNFGSLMRWLRRGVPLPLGAIHNQRSLVALDNLVDLIVTCLTHPAAANQTFLVSDGEDVSTTELLRRMGQAMGHPAHLVPVPAGLLKFAATMLGKPDMAQRLCGSLQVDIEKTRRLLDWTPPLSLDQGLKKAAEGYGREAGI
ncbi:MAG: SDR family oxidoreductase [Candidatus Saccharibacteria bacterium]|nr:SDR family oxidoreductase [Rhodoferax sp.]